MVNTELIFMLLNYYMTELNHTYIKNEHNNINFYSTNNLSKHLLVTEKENHNSKYL